MTQNRNTRRPGEIELERNSLLERTCAEIDSLIAQHHARMPRGSAGAIGGIYARYSSRFQDSIADQVRSLLEEAERRGVFVPREYVFFDMATRGYKDRRPGLNGLRTALAGEELAVLLVFSTNRLFRKAYKSLQFVEEEVVERGGRCIFVNSGIDTADGDRWRAWLQFHAMMDEVGAGMYADHVRAGHQGLFARGLVCGTLPVGYTGDDVPGEFTKRKKPRQRIVIDPAAARYVETVFRWFVHDHVPISEIARRLNSDPDAPRPSRSHTGLWTHRTVRNLLTNACYRGQWSYGKTVTKWQSKKDYARQLPREEPLRTEQRDHLRIVSDELWYAAQAKLGVNGRGAGRQPKDGDHTARPKLLNGFFWCPTHGRALEVSGVHGNAMVCKDCRGTDAASRPLFTYLNRQLALHVLCAKIADLIRTDGDLVDRIISACQQQAEAFQEPDPERLRQLKAQDAKIVRSLEFAVRNLGDTEDETQLAEQLVRQLRQEHAVALAEIKQIEAAQGRQIRIPFAAEVRASIGQLEEVLEMAARGAGEEDAGRVREVFRLMTGGRIDLVQCGQRRKSGGWLQGRFHCDVLGYVVQELTGVDPSQPCGSQEVVVDILPTEIANPELERAWDLYQDGCLNTEIAAELGCSRSKVTQLLQAAARAHGVEWEDGRTRRGRLQGDKEGPPLYVRIADEVKRLSEQGLLFHEMADRLGCCRDLVTRAWQFWHMTRGLEAPDGRTRRKSLACKQAT